MTPLGAPCVSRDDESGDSTNEYQTRAESTFSSVRITPKSMSGNTYGRRFLSEAFAPVAITQKSASHTDPRNGLVESTNYWRYKYVTFGN